MSNNNIVREIRINPVMPSDSVLGGAQYNNYIHTLPRCELPQDCDASYHWHMEICPRTSIPTGFELDSGLCVTIISPEDAAAQLREAL